MKFKCPDCGKRLPSYTNLVAHYLALRDHVHHSFDTVQQVVDYLRGLGFDGCVKFFVRGVNVEVSE